MASDAGADGKQKIAEIAGETETFTLFDVETLSQTLNRENTVYLVVKKSSIGTMVRLALMRYQTYLNM